MITLTFQIPDEAAFGRAYATRESGYPGDLTDTKAMVAWGQAQIAQNIENKTTIQVATERAKAEYDKATAETGEKYKVTFSQTEQSK